MTPTRTAPATAGSARPSPFASRARRRNIATPMRDAAENVLDKVSAGSHPTSFAYRPSRKVATPNSVIDAIAYLSPERPMGDGRPSLRRSVDVSTTPRTVVNAPKATIPGSDSSRKTTASAIVMTAYAATTGDTSATGPSSNERYSRRYAAAAMMPFAAIPAITPGGVLQSGRRTATKTSNVRSPATCDATTVTMVPTRLATTAAPKSATPHPSAAAKPKITPEAEPPPARRRPPPPGDPRSAGSPRARPTSRAGRRTREQSPPPPGPRRPDRGRVDRARRPSHGAPRTARPAFG